MVDTEIRKSRCTSGSLSIILLPNFIGLTIVRFYEGFKRTPKFL